MSHNISTKTNEELLKLITDAAAELEIRRQANEDGGASTQDETDEGGDHPPIVHFP